MGGVKALQGRLVLLTIDIDPFNKKYTCKVDENLTTFLAPAFVWPWPARQLLARRWSSTHRAALHHGLHNPRQDTRLWHFEDLVNHRTNTHLDEVPFFPATHHKMGRGCVGIGRCASVARKKL